MLIAVGGVGLARCGTALQHYPGFTQLWLTPPSGHAPAAELGVSNHQGTVMRYRLVVDRNGHTTATWELTLADGQTWQWLVPFTGRSAISAGLRAADLRVPACIRHRKHGAQAMNRGVPILMYHALSAAHTAAFRRWTLAPDRFEAHLDYISRSGYSTITIAELLRRPAVEAGRDRAIVLTFDDAYADFHSVALPLLTRYGMTATLFVPTGHVGGHSRWMRHDGEGERTILSWTALTEIAICGIEDGKPVRPHTSRAGPPSGR